MIDVMILEDLDEILKIEDLCFSSRWSRENFLYEINENEFSRLFVLKEDDRIIAYADIWIIFERAEITNIAVHPDWQRKGYGEKMLDYLLDFAALNNCEFAFLEVRASNDKAINLYHKKGFMDLRIRKGYYSDNHEDAIEMIKVLGVKNEENISD